MTSTMKIEGGNQVWRNTKGQIHRIDSPAYIGCDGTQAWWVNGKRHCIDGPAVIWIDGTQLWYINNELHRSDGPAVINFDGSKQWWIRGKDITEKVKQWLNMNNKSYPFNLKTQILFKLTFGE